MSKIKAKALAVISRGDDLFMSAVTESDGTLKGYRPAGGTVEFGEHAADTLAREFIEEFNAGLKDIRLLGVLENVFTYRGDMGHEIIFLFQATFSDATMYEKQSMPMLDAKPGDNPYEWVNTKTLPEGVQLFPIGLLELWQNAV